MSKKEGYYTAALAGCADPTVLLYFDGKNMLAHGSDKPLNAEYLLFIDSEPFEHRKIGQNKLSQNAQDWFVEANMDSEPKCDDKKPVNSVYEVVLMVKGQSVKTYVEVQLKSDVYDRVADSDKSVSVLSVRDVAKSIDEILEQA